MNGEKPRADRALIELLAMAEHTGSLEDLDRAIDHAAELVKPVTQLMPQRERERERLIYKAGRIHGAYDAIEAKLGTKPPSKANARKLARLKAEAQAIEFKIGLEVEWPDS